MYQVVSNLLARSQSLAHTAPLTQDYARCFSPFPRHVAEVARGCPSVTSVDLSLCLGLTDQGEPVKNTESWQHYSLTVG